DGRLLALGDRGGHVELWDVKERRQVRRQAVREPGGVAVAFSPDGRTLASWEFNGEDTRVDFLRTHARKTVKAVGIGRGPAPGRGAGGGVLPGRAAARLRRRRRDGPDLGRERPAAVKGWGDLPRGWPGLRFVGKTGWRARSVVVQGGEPAGGARAVAPRPLLA